MEEQLRPKTDCNLDTDFLKLIGIISMAVDHVGLFLMDNYLPFRLVGRLAWPIFAYCSVVGCLYTKNIKKYIIRLAIFALLSQPVYILARFPSGEIFLGYFITLPNIFFTLLTGVAAVYGLKEKRWWILTAALVLALLLPLDYRLAGVLLMLLYYWQRHDRKKCAAMLCLFWIFMVMEMFWWIPGGGNSLIQLFAIAAVPLVCCHTNTGLRIPKWFFYFFYPAHLLVIFLLRVWLKI